MIPEETAGPFPGDGSNGPDVLTRAASCAGHPLELRGVGDGRRGRAADDRARPSRTPRLRAARRRGRLPLALRPRRQLLAVLAGRRQRELPARRPGGRRQRRGDVPSIFPACYSGRWPHIHFEVYPSLDTATDEANKIATSQIALPKDACDTVYATAGYEQSVTNLAQVVAPSDMVFGDDGGVHQLGTVDRLGRRRATVALTVPVGG